MLRHYMDFYEQTRIGGDNCSMTQDMLQSDQYSNYMMRSFYAAECTMRKPIEFATSQVNVNYSAAGGSGNQCGVGGCNIEQNNSLMFTPTVRPKCRISLFQRPFLTVPYLGKGSSNPTLEGQLQQISLNTNKKSVNTSSEVSYIPISNYPLIPAIKNTVTNPQYLVESWTRGGESTRAQRQVQQSSP
jgi:hypothetical protein